ncbi:MAG: hypothetical protein EHM32_08775 [Spirochaetales bacterium]|nr:MAG: hypothetical protein EHM32_08775 [Spirochaetales bacterium]
MPVCVMRHSGSLELDRSIGTATSGERIAIDPRQWASITSTSSCSEMVRGVTQMAESALSIFENAKNLVWIAERAAARRE